MPRAAAATQPATAEAGTQPATGPGGSQPATGTRPAEAPKPKLIPMSFNNASMNDIAKFINEQLGKPVIPGKEVGSIQVTLINPKPLPPDEAMEVLTTALNDAGVAIEQRDKTIHLIPVAQVAQSLLRTVGPEVDPATLSPKTMIVRKVFKVRHYDATKLVDVVKPLLPAYGHITATGSGQVIIVANVERLIMMDGIIRQLDVPGVAGGELRVFPIKNMDVYEIVPMLEKLVAGYLGVEVKAVSAAGAGPPAGERGEGRRSSGGPEGREVVMGPGGPMPAPGGGPGPSAGPGAVTVKAEKTPVLLMPDPRQSCIVVAAPPNVLDQIETWLATLDQPKPPRTQTEIVEAQYSDPGELVNQLNSMLSGIPDDSLRNALRIYPFPSSRRIVIVGSEQNRALVKGWLEELDVADTGVRVLRTFMLKNADAQQVAENIKDLFGESSSRYGGWWGGWYGGSSRGGEDRSKVNATANVRSNSVTVQASPEKMTRIEEQIAEWDSPSAGIEAAPRVFNLRFADPEKTRELLENLFTKKSGPSLPPWWYDEMPDAEPTPVGRLFGQFRFEAYPETGKLIVVSKNEENYQVIEDLLTEIDRPQTAGVPRMIQLKFANAETLAEQLNALLNAPGTPAAILRQGVPPGTSLKEQDSESPYNTSSDQSNVRTQRSTQQQGQQPGTSMMQFWWQSAPTDLIKTRQASNLVGKLRIVPNVEQNLLMVAAPEAYADAIEEFVHDLDRPGQQVLIKAVIAEVKLEDAMSLGYRFSSDPNAFNIADPFINEDALKGLFTYDFVDQLDEHNTITFNIPVTNLINLLHRVTDLRIRSEPKVFTADNQKATFFDGQDVPFIDQSQTNAVGTGLIQSFQYRPVGINLTVRPHITKDRNIDLQVSLEVSSFLPGNTLFGGVIIDRRQTETRVVLEDGRTFMISGILREEEREITRTVPGLGDIPVLGELFKHRAPAKVNTELLIFLTPYVIGPDLPHAPVESEPLQRLREQFPGPAFGPDVKAPTSRPTEMQ
ncbi:MAG: hypothetical protein HY718_13280 [Planctomycetes bacterium]|nr:hypothetical protein [Planctomycetota bacterium]